MVKPSESEVRSPLREKLCTRPRCTRQNRHVEGAPGCDAEVVTFEAKGRRAMTRLREEKRGGGRRNASRVKAIDADIAARARAYLIGKEAAGFGFGEPGYEPKGPDELNELKRAVREHLSARSLQRRSGEAVRTDYELRCACGSSFNRDDWRSPEDVQVLLNMRAELAAVAKAVILYAPYPQHFSPYGWEEGMFPDIFNFFMEHEGHEMHVYDEYGSRWPECPDGKHDVVRISNSYARCSICVWRDFSKQAP